MSYILPAAVFLLMLSVGISLDRADLTTNWRKISWTGWRRLILATFILPPAIALASAKLLSLGPAETVGLFLVGAAPGAPLMTRNIARRGFDMHLAASYQLFSALLTPVMIPLVVFAAAWLYDRHVWIPPRELLWQVARQQFLPLLAGLGLMQAMPRFAKAVQRGLNIAGNLALTVALVALLVKLAPVLARTADWRTPVGALLVATGSIVAILITLPAQAPVRETLAICNANRHVGLALLLAGSHFKNAVVLPVVVCYALAALVVMGVYSRMTPRPVPVATP
jgi:predicted Na+-dependent transporter